MKSSKIRRALMLLACAMLLVCLSVGATLAYLTSTDEVTNTFTVGNVKITLDEAPVDANGEEIDGDRVKANTYKLLPGHDYDKDPTIHVDEASENCWLFVEITNEIAAIEGDPTIAAQMTANGWTQIEEGSNIYWHAVAEAGDDVVVFETFTISGDVANDVLAGYAGKTVVITAYAVQEDGFATAEAAWAATFGAPEGEEPAA